MLTELPVVLADYPGCRAYRVVRRFRALTNRYPRRALFLLREAVTSSQLELAAYNQEFPTSWVCPIWFDIVVWLSLGGVRQLGVLFLVDPKGISPAPGNPRNKQARTNRLAFLKENGVPYLEQWPADLITMESRIEMWLMMLNRTPQVQGTVRAPQKPKKLTKRWNERR